MEGAFGHERNVALAFAYMPATLVADLIGTWYGGVLYIAFVAASIWLNAPGTVVLHDVKFGPNPILLVSIGIHPHVWPENNSDGAVFRFDVSNGPNSVTVMNRFLDPTHVPAERRWNDLTADLGQFKNESVTISIKSLPGPAGNDYADWCLWGEPRIVERAGPQ